MHRIIPGYKEGFQSLYSSEEERKVCFMQNTRKWSTNETMKKSFRKCRLPSRRDDQSGRTV